jgi:hypothetical protein
MCLSVYTPVCSHKYEIAHTTFLNEITITKSDHLLLFLVSLIFCFLYSRKPIVCF